MNFFWNIQTEEVRCDQNNAHIWAFLWFGFWRIISKWQRTSQHYCQLICSAHYAVYSYVQKCDRKAHWETTRIYFCVVFIPCRTSVLHIPRIQSELVKENELNSLTSKLMLDCCAFKVPPNIIWGITVCTPAF